MNCTFVTEARHLPTAKLKAIAITIEKVPAYELVGGDLDEACLAVLGAMPTGNG